MNRRLSVLIVLIMLYGCKANPDKLMYRINIFEALELGKTQNKPILIHFTWHGASYNEFYNDLLVSKKIQEVLNNEYITLQLYVDDKTKLELRDTLGISNIIKSEKSKLRIGKSKTIGNINNALEMDLINSNTQPQYVIVNSDLELLTKHFGYTSGDKRYFIKKLKEGLINFKK